jgi:bacteriorhodopsin
MSMASADFKKLNRQMMIYRIVQTILTGLLIVLAVVFQGHFAALNKSSQFVGSIVTAIVVQLLLIWPVYKLAWRDAGVEIEGSVPNLSTEQQAALRKKRLIGDLWKFCGVAFFVVFVTLAPDAKKSVGAIPVLASTIFSFLLTCLMYFQCFNFSAKKRIKQ